MNEKQLKSLFCKALESGHIKNNNILPTSRDADIRVIEEADFRRFDLLIAAITHEPIIGKDFAYCSNLLVRTQLLEHLARSEKCRIDCIRFYPIEIKSDDDNIDERLPNQIINAILTFGLSVLVLDKRHANTIKSTPLKFLPATVICYSGIDDYFEVISTFDRLISDGIFTFNRSIIAKALFNDKTSARAYNRLITIQRILQKLAFNQIYYENLGLTQDEVKFMQAVAELHVPSGGIKRLDRIIKESSCAKLTDFV